MEENTFSYSNKHNKNALYPSGYKVNVFFFLFLFRVTYIMTRARVCVWMGHGSLPTAIFNNVNGLFSTGEGMRASFYTGFNFIRPGWYTKLWKKKKKKKSAPSQPLWKRIILYFFAIRERNRPLLCVCVQFWKLFSVSLKPRVCGNTKKTYRRHRAKL